MFIAGLANRQDGLIYTANQKTARERGSLRRWIFVTPTGPTRREERDSVAGRDADQTAARAMLMQKRKKANKDDD